MTLDEASPVLQGEPQSSLDAGWLQPWGDIPQKVRTTAVLHVADTLAVMVAAGRLGFARQARDLAASYPRAAGASLIGFDVVTDPMLAALANGALAHSIDLDDGHEFLHPGAAVVAAAIASAEAAETTGIDFLRGVIYGYGVACRLSQIVGVEHRQRGFHPTGTCNTVGAAVGAAVAASAAEEVATAALDIATTAAAGLCAYRGNGADTKSLNAGLAARSGVTAAALAAAGLRPPANSVFNSYGFVAAMSDPPAAPRPAGLAGLEHAVLECYIKPYPSCRRTHSAVAAAIELSAQIGSGAGDVREITVRTFARACEPWLTAWRSPSNALDAMLCMPICVATALVDGTLSLDSMAPSRTTRAEVLRLGSRVRVVEDGSYTDGYPATAPTTVTVVLADGSSVEATADVSGLAADGLDENAVQQKFRNTITSGGRDGAAGGALWRAVLNLPEVGNMASFVREIQEIVA